VWLFHNVINPLQLLQPCPTTLCRINEPPIGYDVNVYTEENLQTRQVAFVTERPIAAGEEFFIDYGLNYDRSLYGGRDDDDE